MALSRPSYSLYRGFWYGIDWLFPPDCGGCGTAGARWCAACRESVARPAEPLCRRCGTPTGGPEECTRCLGNPPGFTEARFWGLFGGPLQNAIHRLKYRHDLGLGEALAREMAAVAKAQQWHADLAVPVPLGPARLKERGYNQAAVLTFPLALQLARPYRPRALVRARETGTQVGLSLPERFENVKGAFRASERQVAGRSVLLVDDVMTTGATLEAAAGALFSAGARRVYALTLARAVRLGTGRPGQGLNKQGSDTASNSWTRHQAQPKA